MFERRDEIVSELLQNQGLVRLPELEALRQGARTAGRPLADFALAAGAVELDALLDAVAAHLGCPRVENVPTELSGERAGCVTVTQAARFGIVPWHADGTRLEILAVDPLRPDLVADVGFALGRGISLVVADPVQVQRLLDRHYRPEPEGREDEPTPAVLAAMAEDAPVVQLVSRILTEAVREKASDVHFEPFADELRIRCRVDGVLREKAPPPRALAVPVASRIKVLANLDIAERRLPQDGRIRLEVDARAVDLRVSTLPTQCGESVVLRVLDPTAGQFGLEQLRMPENVREGFRRALDRPHGIVVVTGPTGSGKTTTLYSGLRAINSPGLKLLTAEDPVEYDVEGVVQVPINPAAGLTFASALRSFLRQDPDVIMVGEIRDLETAQVAVQAALTGHLVLSTLHTNDAPGVVTRLLDLGIEPFLVASTMEAVLAQRLLRRICPACRVEAPVTQAMLDHAALSPEKIAGRPFFRGAGCPECRHSGYRGRVGIYEWLPMSDPLRDLIAAETPALAFRRQACAEGMRTLRDEGLRAAFAGETTLEEMLRHTAD